MGFETVEGLITINATLPLQILHFIILMYILNRILFIPILRMMDERNTFIVQKKEELEKIKKQAEELRQRLIEMEEKAKREAIYERSELKLQALKEAEQLLTESQKHVSEEKQKANKRIQEEMEKVKPILLEQAKEVADEIIKKIIGAKAGAYFAILLFLLMPAYVFAAEGPSRVRIIYNNIMLFVNFGIIAFLFIKYAKKPLLDFLNKEQEKIKNNISKLEDEYDNAKLILNKQQEKLNNIQIYVQEIKNNIMKIAERERQKIIEEAKIKAEKMIEEAKQYYDYESKRAKQRLREELVIMAVSFVKERLKKGITPEENEKIITQFIKEIEKSARN